jgi:peroxiredoxin/outer membrane lipoprotein-sorting protein
MSMRSRAFTGAVGIASVCASLFAFAAAQTRRGPEMAVEGDVSALYTYRLMHRAFREARSLSFESEYVWEAGGVEIGRSTYRAWLKKPNYARLESRSGDGTKTGVLILDGRAMWIYWPNGRPYIHESDSTANARDGMRSYLRKDASDASHSIARETSVLGTGMSMTILDPSIFHGSPDLLDAFLESVRNAGSGNVDGEVCDVIEASYMRGERTRVFWISRRDHLPRKLEETVRVKRDITVREHWSGVVVNGTIAKDLFLWKPPAGWAEYRLNGLGDGLLRPGSVAPDFDLPLLDGTRFRLSENRGKIVWLSFWRLSCVPCRAELEHLQKIQDRLAGDGLLVLGFNCSDDSPLARRFLHEKGIGFPNVADTTAAAREVFQGKYQVAGAQSAVPLNYIIDRDGTVAGGWYGYRKGDGRGEKILRRLGVIK